MARKKEFQVHNMSSQPMIFQMKKLIGWKVRTHELWGILWLAPFRS